MVLSAIAGAEMAMRDVGIPIEFGSGVAAAQAHFSESANAGVVDRRLAASA
jgi:alanine-glyoxylate transaminase/serine-glyoxylate transaminase/serine-pyruvate transaminase